MLSMMQTCSKCGSGIIGGRCPYCQAFEGLGETTAEIEARVKTFINDNVNSMGNFINEVKVAGFLETFTTLDEKKIAAGFLKASGKVQEYQIPSNLKWELESKDHAFWWYLMSAASLVSSGICGYHGYKRNDSWFWAIHWGFWGGIFWPLLVPVAFAQGLGKPKAPR